MMPWADHWQQAAEDPNLAFVLQPVNSYCNWMFDCWVYTFLNLWYMPSRLPEVQSETNRWLTHVTMNGIKAD